MRPDSHIIEVDTAVVYTRTTHVVLWTLQGGLALLFLFAGAMLLVTPGQALAQQSGLSAGFLKFIGLAEIAGALGLVLPGLLGIARPLTALAAAGLVIIMAGAVALTAGEGQIGAALIPGVVGVLAGFVAYKRCVPVRSAVTTFLPDGLPA